MPTAPLRPCSHPGCAALSQSGRCSRHRTYSPGQNAKQRPKTADRGYGYRWQQKRAEHLRKHPTCVHCGAQATQVDHITPLRRGGTNDEGNLQSLCHSCHSKKTARYDNNKKKAGLITGHGNGPRRRFGPPMA